MIAAHTPLEITVCPVASRSLQPSGA